MANLTHVFHWLTQHPLSTAVAVFGGAALTVALYTYVYDYKILIRKGLEARR